MPSLWCMGGGRAIPNNTDLSGVPCVTIATFGESGRTERSGTTAPIAAHEWTVTPMAEYIEREAAVKVCTAQYKECLRKSDWCGDTVAWNIGFGIKAIPAADVVPVVHGRWEQMKVFRTQYVCSECGDLFPDFRSNYCPNCGADMRGE